MQLMCVIYPFQSLKATRNFSVSDWSKNFEVVFQDEEGERNIQISIVKPWEWVLNWD